MPRHLRLAAFVGALLCHANHPGVDGPYLIASQHPLAMLQVQAVCAMCLLLVDQT